MEDVEATKEYTVMIALRDGTMLGPYVALWGEGVLDLVRAYESYLATGTQSSYKFRLQISPTTGNSTVYLSFANVLAIQTQVS